MKRFAILLPFFLIASAAFSAGEEDGHMHGPDGRHIVTAEDAGGASSFILSHHDMRVESNDGETILGVEVNSTISPKDNPTEPIHTEKNVYEPENEVYGSHLTYSEPGEYILSQDVRMPDGKQIQVEFPIFVPAVAAMSEGEAGASASPNLPLMIGGGLAVIIALFVAFRMGKKSASAGVAGILGLAFLLSFVPVPVVAAGEEDGHMHGPDGRHIVTEADAASATGPQLRAYVGANQEETVTKTVDGVTFVLSIENEEMQPDLDLVSVSEAQMELIGLDTASAEITGSATALQTTGKVSANPNGLVKVNARTSGRVIRLGALPGTNIRRGQLLAVIESPELADAQANYRRSVAELSQSQAGVRVAEATVAAARTEVQVATRNLDRQTRLAQAGEFSSPSVERARSAVSEARAALATYTAEEDQLESLVARLRAGLESGVVAKRDLEHAEAEFAEAKANRADAAMQLRLAQESLEREEEIAKQGLRNAREVDQARSQLEIARSSEKSAESRHAQARADVARVQSSIRVARDQIALLGGIPGGGHTVSINAPISAEVEHRFVSVGQTVAAGELLYDLLNAEIVWVLADVYEKDVPKVRLGQTIQVVADAYPDQVYEGEVAFVHNEVDPQTRTTPVRIVIDNPGERLKQNMFVRVNLGVGGDSAVTVPASAVQNDKGLDVVFVEEKEGVFRRTLVQVKGSFGNRVIVEGVEPGRQVVTSGSYQLLALGGSR